MNGMNLNQNHIPCIYSQEFDEDNIIFIRQILMLTIWKSLSYKISKHITHVQVTLYNPLACKDYYSHFIQY